MELQSSFFNELSLCCPRWPLCIQLKSAVIKPSADFNRLHCRKAPLSFMNRIQVYILPPRAVKELKSSLRQVNGPYNRSLFKQ